MSTESEVTEVFEDVEADPDAILEACDVESPEALVESGGDHEATTDPGIDADDETAAALFAELESAAADTSTSNDEEADTSTSRDEADTAADRDEQADTSTSREEDGDTHTVTDADDGDRFVVDADAVYITEPIVIVGHGAEREASTETADSEGTTAADRLTLVGPEPSTTRVENDAFGRVDPVENLSDFQWIGGSAGETRR